MASFVYLPPMVKHVFKFKMDKVINLRIPHVGELIFETIDTPELNRFGFGNLESPGGKRLDQKVERKNV